MDRHIALAANQRLPRTDAEIFSARWHVPMDLPVEAENFLPTTAVAFALVSAQQRDATHSRSVFRVGGRDALSELERRPEMIRIWGTNEPSAMMITIDGELVADYVDSVQACVDQAMLEQKRIHLFLRDVAHIDEAGCALLHRLAANGVVLSASGLYSSYLVAEIMREI